MFEYSTRNPSVPVACYTGTAMHTQAEMLVAYLGETEARAVMDEVWGQLKACEQKCNRFHRTSALAEINSHAADKPVTVDDELYMMLEMCRTFCRLTDGCFDICANKASRTSSLGVDAYTLDPTNHTIRFAAPDIRLDMGGFAKGYILEQMQRTLKAHGVTCGILNIGNSSSCAIGHHPYGKWWPVSVCHPFYAGREAFTVHLCDSALSISGLDNSGCPHIVDPTTGNLLERPEMIAVEGTSPLIVEVLSTALYVSEPSHRAEILERFTDYKAVEIRCLTDGTSIVRPIERE